MLRPTYPSLLLSVSPSRAAPLTWLPPWPPRPYDHNLTITDEIRGSDDFKIWVVKGIKEGDPDALLYMGWESVQMWKRTDKDTFSRGIRYIKEAQRRGHPGALCCLGAVEEHGFGGLKDTKKAITLYQCGFEENAHLGCAYSLYVLTRITNYDESTMRVVHLARRSDLFDIAASTGSASFLPAVLHAAAHALRDKSRPSWSKADGEESTRLGLGASLNDTIMMAEYARAVLRTDKDDAIGYNRDSLCESMCIALLANDSANAQSKSIASTLLGGIAPDFSAEQRERYAFAVEVCGSDIEAIDRMALVCLPVMLFEGLGGPPDYALGLSTVLIGCERDIGPCLQLEAQRQRYLGNRVAEADLWQRAANRHMPLAMSVVQGISVEAAMRTIPYYSFFFDPALRGHITMKAAVGSGSRGEGMHGLFGFRPEHPKAHPMVPTCDACHKKGVYGATLESLLPKLPVLLACGACKRALYCSLECQKAAWSAHKAACLAARKTLAAAAGKVTAVF